MRGRPRRASPRRRGRARPRCAHDRGQHASAASSSSTWGIAQPAWTAIEGSSTARNDSDPSGAVRAAARAALVPASDESTPQTTRSKTVAPVVDIGSRSSVEASRDVQRREHADRLQVGAVDDEQVRGAMLGHQLCCAFERLVWSDQQDRLAADPAAVCSSRSRTVAAAIRSRSETTPHAGPRSPLPCSTTMQCTECCAIVRATSESGWSRSRRGPRASHHRLGRRRAEGLRCPASWPDRRRRRPRGHRRLARSRLRGTTCATSSSRAAAAQAVGCARARRRRCNRRERPARGSGRARPRQAGRPRVPRGGARRR